MTRLVPLVAMLGRARSWLRKRLFARLITATFTLLVLHGIVSSFHTFQLERRVLHMTLDTFANKLAETTASSWTPTVVLGEWPELDEHTESFVRGSSHFTYVRVELADGRTASQWPRKGLAAVADADSLRVYSAPMTLRGAPPPGTVHLGIPLARWERELQSRVVTHFLEYALALVVIALAMYWMLQRMVGRPVQELDLQVQRLGKGDLESAITTSRSDELGRLGATLEQMRVHLKTSYAELGAQNTRLLALDKLKTEFLANMSHEIRTPLNSIIGCTEFLGDSNLAAPDRGVYVEILRRNGVHLLRLVNEILDYSKLETGHMVVEKMATAVRPLVDEVIASLTPRLEGKAVALTVRYAEGVPEQVVTDPVRLRQILLNVVDNAVKFTQEGSVAVEVAFTGDRGGRLAIVVRDTGIGITEEALQRLFQPFTQADTSTTRRFGGTGLGLMISRRLAHLLGGELTLESTEGEGSTVRIVVEARVATPSPQPSAEAPVLPGNERRVLLVEDGPDNQKLIKAMLERAGCKVAIAENGQVGCDMALEAAERGARFDLIVMDLQMPVMDGITATRTLRARGVTAPIVALTANAVEEERQRCFEAGCTAFTTKPISRQRLAEVLRNHLPEQAESGNAATGTAAQ